MVVMHVRRSAWRACRADRRSRSMENSSCWPRLDRRAAYAMRPTTLFGCMLPGRVIALVRDNTYDGSTLLFREQVRVGLDDLWDSISRWLGQRSRLSRQIDPGNRRVFRRRRCRSCTAHHRREAHRTWNQPLVTEKRPGEGGGIAA